MIVRSLVLMHYRRVMDKWTDEHAAYDFSVAECDRNIYTCITCTVSSSLFATISCLLFQ